MKNKRMLRSAPRALMALLIIGSSSSLLNVQSQEKSPSLGKITYKQVTITVGATRVLGSLVAERGKAVLLVFTTPPGAQISVNGQPKGTSDKTGVYREDVLLNKQYKIGVSADKYLPYEETVSVATSNTYFVPADLTATFGGLHLYGVPPNAALFLDNKKIAYQHKEGTNEVVLAEIPVGAHQLKIEHPDYVEWDSTVAVVPENEIGVTPELLPAAKVVVASLPAVEVLIDNVKQGVTDSSGSLNVPRPVEPGEHALAFSKPGYVKLARTHNLARGNNLISQPELEPNPSYVEFAEFFKDGMGLWRAPGAWQWGQKQEAVAIQGTEPGFVSNRSYRDFDLNFNVKFTNGTGAAWVLRAKDPKNYYLFALSVKERLLRTFVVEDGKMTAIPASPIVVDPTAATSYRIRAEVQGDRIKHYLKNNTTADEEGIGVLVDGRFRYGTVGLAAVSGEQFLVEDFFVKPYPESSASR